jgi:hypothetical protein
MFILILHSLAAAVAAPAAVSQQQQQGGFLPMSLSAASSPTILIGLQDLRPYHIADYLQFISNTQLFWFLVNMSYDHGCHPAN